MTRDSAESARGGATVESPLTAPNFSFAPERIERLKATPKFQEIATSDK